MTIGDYKFQRADVLNGDIEETDLLFLDTRHNASQLREELRRHAGKVRQLIVTHGTTAHASAGESPEEAGIWPVVEEFLAEGRFRLRKRYENNHGLTVLERAESVGPIRCATMSGVFVSVIGRLHRATFERGR